MSADVFGSATRNMGIGQTPRKLARYLDAIYPMVYPSYYGLGELGLADPNAEPGRTVALSLRDFAADLTGQETRLVPWLQDFSSAASRRTTFAGRFSPRAMLPRTAILWNPSGIYSACSRPSSELLPHGPSTARRRWWNLWKNGLFANCTN